MQCGAMVRPSHSKTEVPVKNNGDCSVPKYATNQWDYCQRFLANHHDIILPVRGNMVLMGDCATPNPGSLDAIQAIVW